MEQKSTQVHHVNPTELVQSILAGFDQKIEALEKRLHQQTPTEYITRQDTSKLLGVSLVTLHDWVKRGILKPYRIGNRIRFKRKEIEETLESSAQTKK